MKIIISLSFLLLAFFQIGKSQTSTRDQVVKLSEVLGFFYGQKMSIDWIKKEFPDLRNSATQAELKWELEFGKVEKEIERRLREILAEKYDEFIVLSKQKLMEVATFGNLSRSDAIVFIEKVNERAKGNIEEQFKARVLMYHPDFIKYPHQEFNRGYKNKFQSTGYEIKSKGIKLRVDYPASWKESEGIRPNILFKAINENGEGLTSINILIKDLAPELKGAISQEEWKHLISNEGNRELSDVIFTENALIEMMSEHEIVSPKFSDYKRVVIDGNPGAKINVVGKKRRLEYEIPMALEQYAVISKNYLVITTFSTIGISIEEAKNEFEKYRLMFSLMMNSMAILNRYE